MLAIVKFVMVPFDDIILDSLLLTFAEVSLGRIVAHNAVLLAGKFTDRIAPTRAAITTMESVVTDVKVKLALQKARIEAKKAFRMDLPANLAKIYGALLAVYGPDAPEMIECFPEGRKVFTQCAEEQVNNHLEQLQASVTAHAAALPAATVTLAGSLVAGWASVYEAAGAAKDAKSVTAASREVAVAALRVELFKNLMTCGLYFPDDKAKAELLFPQYLLEGRATPVTPGITTLSNTPCDPQTGKTEFTFTAEGAQTFTLKRRRSGELDFAVRAEGIVAVNGVGTFTEERSLPGLYEYVAEAVNGTRVGPPSHMVSVGQT